jgi:hypothetical protein
MSFTSYTLAQVRSIGRQGATARVRDAAGQQTGSNQLPYGPTRPLENRGGSSERSGTDSCAHLRLSDDPSRSLTVQRTGRQ